MIEYRPDRQAFVIRHLITSRILAILGGLGMYIIDDFLHLFRVIVTSFQRVSGSRRNPDAVHKGVGEEVAIR